MNGNNRKIRRVDRIALGATFAAATLIVVMFGFTANATPQAMPVTASGAMSSLASEGMPSPCPVGRR